MRFFLLSLISLVSCAAPMVPSFGFFAYDTQRVRDVICLQDPAWLECEQVTRGAIGEINEALGWEHYHFAGTLAPENAGRIIALGGVLVGFLDEPEDATLGVLGATHAPANLKGRIQGALIRLTSAAILPPIDAMWTTQSVLRHELLHAMGVDHAPCDGAFLSSMTPSEHCPAHKAGLSEGDRETLRRAYPR